jgi:hypothetical protein
MNRAIATIVALIVMSAAVNALEGDASTLKEAVTSGDANRINSALIQLNAAVTKHELVDQSSWDKPSPERLQRRHDIMAALEPVKGELVKLTQHENRTVARNASVVLGHSSGGNEVYESLKDNLQRSPSAPIASTALYSLYQLGRADDEVRTLAAARIAGYNQRSESQVAFGLLNLGAVWPLPEALPVCIEMLKSNEPVGSKMVAASAIMKLGPAAAEALPELQRFLAQLRAQSGDFRDINTLERAVRVVSGQTDAPSPRAPQATPVAATPSPATPVPSATPTASPQPATRVAQAPVTAVEHRTPVWPWVVGILALVVIVAVALKRRA